MKGDRANPPAMTEKKRKSRDEKWKRQESIMKMRGNSSSKTLNSTRRSGPRLPSRLAKVIGALNPIPADGDRELSSNEDMGVYEYDEGIPEEESKKNRRFDPVENYEYELPENFQDEEVPSDDDESDKVGGPDNDDLGDNKLSESSNDDQAEDDRRHIRMLEGITGLPSETFEDKKRKNDVITEPYPESEFNPSRDKKRKNDVVITEPYPESEFNPSRDVLDGDNCITIQDLLDPLHGKPGYSKLRKRIHQVEKKSTTVQASLPKVHQERIEREAAYVQSKKDIAKWEPLVKKNREAPTIFFGDDIKLAFSTVGEIASGFKPRTDFEKNIVSLLHDDKITEAYEKDGARLLELNEVSIEDVKERQNQLAKMRSLLFRHETKAKRIKNIKSKTYHRLLKKGRMKSNPEASKELAKKQEFKRAEERMTLRHKNSSKWAKRILKRGLNAQDEGTRAALSEQLHQHSRLSRKINSMKDGSSSSDDDDNDSEISAGSDGDGQSRLLARAKEKTLKVVNVEDEMPNTGVLALPFMVRGLKKQKEAADEEAKLALKEYESSLKQLDGKGGAKTAEAVNSCGRRVFNATTNLVQNSSNSVRKDCSFDNCDSEDDFLDEKNVNMRDDDVNDQHDIVKIDPDLHREESKILHDQGFDNIISVPAPKTTYEVSICVSGPPKKKVKRETDVDATPLKSSTGDKSSNYLYPEEGSADGDSDDEEHMVDGILTNGSKPTYELPSQAELIQQAFAGDDVEEDFEKEKLKDIDEENPEPEEPVTVPGWGQWTDVQKKKGIPLWKMKEHEMAKKKTDEERKKRKDASLEHVIISEKVDKKSEKLFTKALPFPYTSKEVFENSCRMPIGPEFNPASVVGALNRPAVVKKGGVIINPIEFKEVDPYEKEDGHGLHKRRRRLRTNRAESRKGKS